MTTNERSIEERIARLLSPERERELDPFTVITFLPAQPYDHVADVGCGPGYFTIPLAKHLVHGRVHALDTLDEMLEVTRQRVAEARLGNVEVQKCGETEFPVPAGALDGALLSLVLHQINERVDDRIHFLQAVRALLRPGGWCSVLEWYRIGPGEGGHRANRIQPDELADLGRKAGYGFRGWRDMNSQQYMATLRN